MRDFIKVLDQMLSHVPSTETVLIHELKSRQDSASYTPPEDMRMRWIEVAHILYASFGDETTLTGWQRTVVDFWLDKS
jgi:hypothetical protein